MLIQKLNALDFLNPGHSFRSIYKRRCVSLVSSHREPAAWAQLSSSSPSRWHQALMAKCTWCTELLAKGKTRWEAEIMPYHFLLWFSLYLYLAFISFLQVFIGNTDNDSTKTNLFEPPIVAQYIRIIPVVCRKACTLRLELVGCELNSNSDACFLWANYSNICQSLLIVSRH